MGRIEELRDLLEYEADNSFIDVESDNSFIECDFQTYELDDCEGEIKEPFIAAEMAVKILVERLGRMPTMDEVMQTVNIPHMTKKQIWSRSREDIDIYNYYRPRLK
jgi:hypothetical protein